MYFEELTEHAFIGQDIVHYFKSRTELFVDHHSFLSYRRLVYNAFSLQYL